MERNETQVIVSQIIYLFIWWRVRHCTVSATSVACSHTHAHSESGRRLTLDQPTNQLTNYCDRPTIGTFEVVRWWLGLVALVCSVRRTLSHVVRPVALGSDDLNFKWGTTGPFKVSRPLVGKKANFCEATKQSWWRHMNIWAPKFLRALLKIKMPSQWPRWPWIWSHWSQWSWWDTTHSCSGDDF